MKRGPGLHLKGELLFGPNSSMYAVVDVIGEGSFGKVSKCLRLEDKRVVAVKVLKRANEDTKKELRALKAVSVLDPDRANIIRFFEHFEDMGRTCLAFEMLDMDLHSLLERRQCVPLSSHEIRPIAKQLLVALDALKGLRVLHTDIKLDNIMLVDAVNQPFRVKLIDFGLAVPTSAVRPGAVLQPRGYRAPEVYLGLPVTEAIDMWGLGCVLVALYLAEHLFPITCDYLMTEREFMEVTHVIPRRWPGFFNVLDCLEDLIDIQPNQEAAELRDSRAFFDLLKGMLQVDRELRVTPAEALQHPYITMSHLSGDPSSTQYLITCQRAMAVCPAEDTLDGETTAEVPEPALWLIRPPSPPPQHLAEDDDAQAEEQVGPALQQPSRSLYFRMCVVR
ncbi:homeodomain-interacting protein kinase 1-like [Salarias fasciatus]|uniref:homeodomain-interacting protein kinase 1-like n=1 Tax=Salarias fasciatus TaxID=181472 RepID=UPI0011770607|nr:homeodomain-interacting protein kinase 1-like [Salarias fasciatus]